LETLSSEEREISISYVENIVPCETMYFGRFGISDHVINIKRHFTRSFW